MSSAEELAPLLREQDKEEVWAASHHTGLEALQWSVSQSEICVAVRLAGVISAMFGIVQVSARATMLGMRPFGCIWFMTGNACDQHPVSIIKAAKRLVPEIHRASNCVAIGNWMDVRYDRALLLARLVGFRIVITKPHGVEGMPFHLVSRSM